MEVGEKIYVESLLSDTEYRECSKKYPSTYQSSNKPPFINSEFKWRYRMGPSMTEEEIKIFNKNVEILKRRI
jgi:hypothetical protein